MSEEIKIDSRIKNAGSLAKESFSYLTDLQKGDRSIIKSGQDFIDCHIQGLLPSDVIVYAANSGVGKTKLLFDTLDLILDEKVNSEASEIVSLEYSLEMKFLNRILRDTNKRTGKKKSDILQEEFTKEEREIVKRYYKGLQDKRRFVCEESITTREFYEMTRNFCELNKDKAGVIISLDHVLLLKKTDRSEDPLETLTAYINQLRKEFKNVYFILLSQFNRSSFSTIADKNNDMIPRASMIYGSSHFEFLSSYIIGIMDPFKMGVSQFLKVNKERYDWLEDYMGDEDSKGKVSFDTTGNMFYFVLKTRESDQPYRNLFIREMELTEEQLNRMKSENKKDDTFSKLAPPDFSKPKQTQENPYKDLPQGNTSTAFDPPDFSNSNDEVPF
jgi:hypothetical protein